MAAEYHNNVQLNSPEATWHQETFSYSGMHSSEITGEGCCPPITASNNQKRIGQLALFILLQLQLSNWVSPPKFWLSIVTSGNEVKANLLNEK